jgi:hypothetical protein
MSMSLSHINRSVLCNVCNLGGGFKIPSRFTSTISRSEDVTPPTLLLRQHRDGEIVSWDGVNAC